MFTIIWLTREKAQALTFLEEVVDWRYPTRQKRSAGDAIRTRDIFLVRSVLPAELHPHLLNSVGRMRQKQFFRTQFLTECPVPYD